MLSWKKHGPCVCRWYYDDTPAEITVKTANQSSQDIGP